MFQANPAKGARLDPQLFWIWQPTSMFTAERTSNLSIKNKTKMKEILVGFEDNDTPHRDDGSSKVATRWEATVNGKSN